MTVKKTRGYISVSEYVHKRIRDGKVHVRILVGIHLNSYKKKERDLLLFKTAELAEYALDSVTYGLVGIAFDSSCYNRNEYLCKLQRFAQDHSLKFEVSPINTEFK